MLRKGVVSFTVILIVLTSGCISNDEEVEFSYYQIDYEVEEQVMVFEKGNTTQEIHNVTHIIDVPTDVIDLRLDLNWEGYRISMADVRGGYSNHSYAVEIGAFDGAESSCRSSNRTWAGSNIVFGTSKEPLNGSISIKCDLNPIPMNKSVQAKSVSQARKDIDHGATGNGTWYITMIEHDDWYTHIYKAEWELNVSYLRYYGTVTKQ